MWLRYLLAVYHQHHHNLNHHYYHRIFIVIKYICERCGTLLRTCHSFRSLLQVTCREQGKRSGPTAKRNITCVAALHTNTQTNTSRNPVPKAEISPRSQLQQELWIRKPPPQHTLERDILVYTKIYKIARENSFKPSNTHTHTYYNIEFHHRTTQLRAVRLQHNTPYKTQQSNHATGSSTTATTHPTNPQLIIIGTMVERILEESSADVISGEYYRTSVFLCCGARTLCFQCVSECSKYVCVILHTALTQVIAFCFVYPIYARMYYAEY